MELSHDGNPGGGDLATSEAAENQRSKLILTELFRFISPRDACVWAENLIAWFGSIGAVLGASDAAKARVAGDPRPATLLSAVRRAANAGLREEAYKPPIFSTSGAVVRYFQAELAHSPVEQVRVLFLGGRNQLLRDALVGIGSIDESPLYPREIMRQALEVNATSLILVHNHPSGSALPSSGDEQATRLVAQAARTLDIQLHDHLIVAKGQHSSFRALGLL